MALTPSLLLQCVSLPVVPALHVSFRGQREGTQYAFRRGKDTYNGSECTYKNGCIPVCICLALAALLQHAAGRPLPDKTRSAQCPAAYCQRH